MNPDLYAMITQILLQPFRTICVPGTFMGCGNLHFKPGILLCSRRHWPFAPGVVAACPDLEDPAQQRDRIVLSHHFDPVVFHRDSFAK
jgi:hypothetical protein